MEGQVVQVAEGILEGLFAAVPGVRDCCRPGRLDVETLVVRSRFGWRPMTTVVWRVASGSQILEVGAEPDHRPRGRTWARSCCSWRTGPATAPSEPRSWMRPRRRERRPAMWSEPSGALRARWADPVRRCGRRLPPRLIIFGAVDFAAQLAAAAKLAPWRAFVVDPRKRFAHCFATVPRRPSG